MAWTLVTKPAVTWSAVAKPSPGTAPDGFLSDGNDGFYSRPHTDGFFSPDGVWTPVVVENVVWALVGKPT